MAKVLINRDISDVSELKFRMTIPKALAGPIKGMRDIRETLFGEIKSHSAEIRKLKSKEVEMKKATTEVQ